MAKSLSALASVLDRRLPEFLETARVPAASVAVEGHGSRFSRRTPGSTRAPGSPPRPASRPHVQLALSVGKTLPLHVTAMGRAVLAALPPQEREELLEQLLPDPRHTDLVVDLAQIRTELREAERRGWATADRHDDVVRVGAAVIDAADRPIGAISVSGPTYRVAPKLHELGEDCRGTARAISAELGA